MDDGARNIEINPITAGLVILQVIFTIIMIISFQNILKYEPIDLSIDASGILGQIENLPERGQESIEYYIYKAVADNGANGNIQKNGVEIREGSLVNNYYENTNVHYVNFIADIPDVKQSYQIYYMWSDDELNQYISPNDSAGVICLNKEQLIYGDFNCTSGYKNVRESIIGQILFGYSYLLPGFDNLSVKMDTDKAKLKINYMACGSQCECKKVSESEKKAAVQGFEDFVKSLGFRPQDISYYFSNCD